MRKRTRRQPREGAEQEHLEGQGPKRKSVTNRLITSLFVTLIVIVLAFAAYIGVMASTGGFKPSKDIVIEVPQGASQASVAQELEDKQVIFNDDIFRLYLRLNPIDNLQAGTYKMQTHSSFAQAAENLAQGAKEMEAGIAIPEGTDIESMATIIEQNTPFSAQDFMALVTSPAYFQKLLATYPELLADVSENDNVRYKLEGYLFPATYQLREGQDLEAFVTQMVDETNKFYQSNKPAFQASDLSVNEIFTLASLVEAEASTTEDRAMIAGVFYNRLADKMPIQSDISVNYALGEHKSYVTIKDTQVDSPYNLYKNPGLGPGPYNNPGAESLKAVLNPKENDYYYFVADLSTGEVYYSKTYEDHLKLVDEHVSEEDAKLAQPKTSQATSQSQSQAPSTSN
ncbi:MULTISPECIES: endolytic transglycosylase MltG [Aerococcus]|uniref:Endolytic murein transglycosylase n=1 Tax=Aerococcus sanguinicola TaxID=119206 RepID=A0A5N1GL38_9LACT|nr:MULTISPECIES: endolytic transglycosylase MltG [Aerococcus]KAA9301683.1 endolytic transglycosylase MltG [Aerococcus sanguinicola]MDK6368904.1 endolytic transglycosylase MltG [Aerococcus sp. UMB9870]MDK6680242.1 endolytic transglycosylase MltG [Aerococcus sp. UMB8608]MDK6687283.1 endolytic transglycosylase MltG [Aerococcus sp. UMB8623]MDK6940380.1 endolytic transglycosylase MltG [Aerococcus sp. UMB8487]